MKYLDEQLETLNEKVHNIYVGFNPITEDLEVIENYISALEIKVKELKTKLKEYEDRINQR